MVASGMNEACMAHFFSAPQFCLQLLEDILCLVGTVLSLALLFWLGVSTNEGYHPLIYAQAGWCLDHIPSFP